MTSVAKPSRVLLLMDSDDRLAAAAGGAVRHFGDAAGLETEATLELQASVLSACHYCFQLQPAAIRFQVLFQRLSDRIQIEFSFPGNDSHLGGATPTWPGVDEVQSQASLLRLTKFVPPAAASA